MKLNKQQTLLFWMSTLDDKRGFLTPDGRDALVKNGIFPNYKSISNALYSLSKSGFVDRCSGTSCWVLTDDGFDYIQSIINENSNTNSYVDDEEPDLPDDPNDADFFAEAEGVEDEDDTAPDEASYVNDAYKYMAQAFQHMADAFKHMNDVFKLM